MCVWKNPESFKMVKLRDFLLSFDPFGLVNLVSIIYFLAMKILPPIRRPNFHQKIPRTPKSVSNVFIL